jgi:hypothetical protein
MLAPVGKVSTSSVEALRKVHKPVAKTKPELNPINVAHSEKHIKQEQPKPKENLEGREDNLSQLLKEKRKRSGQDGDA